MDFIASGTFSTALHYRSKILGPTSLLLNMTQCSFAETPLLYCRLGPERKPNPGNTIIVLWVLDKSNWTLPSDVRLGFGWSRCSYTSRLETDNEPESGM